MAPMHAAPRRIDAGSSDMALSVTTPTAGGELSDPARSADQPGEVAEPDPGDRHRPRPARTGDADRVEPRLRDRRRGREPAARLSREAAHPGDGTRSSGTGRGHGRPLAAPARHPESVLRAGRGVDRPAPRGPGGVRAQAMARMPTSVQ